jgi:integrase
MGAEALMKARQGVSSIEERRIKDSETLKGFLEARYRDYLLSNHKAAKTSIWILEVVFKEFLNLRLEDIDINKVEKWRVKQSQSLKPSTMNRRTAALKAALSAAKKWGIISNNPLADLSLKKVIKQPVQFLSDTQLVELKSVLQDRDYKMIRARIDYNEWLTVRGKDTLPDYDEIECSHADHLTPLAILIMDTGLRLSEALTLQWKHVSEDYHSITVVSGKTGNYRVIPTTSDVQGYLRTLKRLNEAYCKQRADNVFVTTKGQSIKGVKTSWNGIRDKLSFDCDWRMLRRTFGSRLIRKGVSVYHVSQLLGHSNVSTTEEWYIALDMESKRKAVGVLDPF